MSFLHTLVAGCVAVVTFLMILPVIRKVHLAACPTVLAFVVAALTFLSLKELGDGLISMILLGYGALGLSLLSLAGWARWNRRFDKKR